MPRLPPFDPDTLCPPPGRYPMTWTDAEAALVLDQRFQASTTRSPLWKELSMHRALVEATMGASAERIWLAGSFVSTKLDPGDVDLAYLHDARSWGALEREEIAYLDELQDSEWCLKHGMRIDAYVLRLPATVEFEDLGVVGAMAPGDAEVFQELGLYDEIWQRCRGGNGGRRGYVEVSQ
jgi:uncharacterized protein DUF6932